MTTPGPTIASAELADLARALDDAYPGGERLALLVRMQAIIDAEMRPEVQTMRNRHATWADVGRALGMTRQGAQQRFGQ